jgi:hypothetical protein
MTDMSEPSSGDHQIVIIGPDGTPIGTAMPDNSIGGDREITDLVQQPAKVMRIGSMIKQLLDEVKSAPLDDASRARLRDIHTRSIKELEDGLAPELVDELERLSLPFTNDVTPSDRAGATRGLARRAVPRHPDRSVCPADGRARPVRGDASARDHRGPRGRHAGRRR